MAHPNTKQRRGPAVLVTDAREPPWRPRPSPNPSQRPPNSSTKVISVDNVLAYASEIPSGQRRGPPNARPLVHHRTPSGRHPLDPKLSGRMAPQHIPARSSKVSEKLVLLPETSEGVEGGEDEKDGRGVGEEERPPTDEEVARLRKVPDALRDKTYAERLPKARRTEKLARVTAYCTAQAYKLRSTAEFVRSNHGARTKLYDDCLYVVYHLPLLGGSDGYRVRSSPVLKSPGGKAVLDEEIERSERREYQEGYFGEEVQYGVPAPLEEGQSPREGRSPGGVSPGVSEEERQAGVSVQRARSRSGNRGGETDGDAGNGEAHRRVSDTSTRSMSPGRIPANAMMFGELFIFSYGVAVFWNFTERQEKDILADLTFSTAATGISLVSRPQSEEDFETEEFHFEYNGEIPRPRVFNDMITLRSGDHMIKLTMSHAIAQSTKLSFFEERMAGTMIEAQYVPRRLALTGKLGMKREEVVKILGKLFMSRVDVNLSSNMLDVPDFFWNSEPTLMPLYSAVREYLEIKPRIQVLNERCRVFLDLAEILSDAIADKKMTRITWIIIVLIVLSILVTCSEVLLRFAILERERRKGDAGMGMLGGGVGLGVGPKLLAIGGGSL